jgi:hypothetical protein
MQFSLWSKYSPQHPVLKHPQFMFLSYCHRQCFTSIWAKLCLVYSNLHIFLKADERTEGSGLNGSVHYQNPMSSYYPPGTNFDLLLSFPNT